MWVATFKKKQKKQEGASNQNDDVQICNSTTVGARIPNIQIPNTFENRTLQSSVFEWLMHPFCFLPFENQTFTIPKPNYG